MSTLPINLKAANRVVGRSDTTTRFYDDIRKYDVMSFEEEKKWFDVYKNGKTQAERDRARELLILCNQRAAVAAAKNYSTADTLMDYVSEANLGLIDAIENYDPTKGAKLITYAMQYFRRNMNTYKNQSQLVRRTNRAKTYHIVSKVTSKFMQEHERKPTIEELLDLVNGELSVKMKDKLDLLDMRLTDIDANYEEDGASPVVSSSEIAEYNMVSASYNDYEKTSEDDFSKTLLKTLMGVISDREKKILKMRFGIPPEGTPGNEMSISEIADKFGITNERVRQLEKESIEKMKEEYFKKLNHR